MSFAHAFRSMVADGREKIRDINRKYATPRIEMSPAVRIALLTLRVYLLLLVGLLVYKFVTVLMQ
jgi:hypothetical protein